MTFVVVVLVTLVLVRVGDSIGGGLLIRMLRRGAGDGASWVCMSFFGLGEDSFLLFAGFGVSGIGATGGGGAAITVVVSVSAAATGATGAGALFAGVVVALDDLRYSLFGSGEACMRDLTEVSSPYSGASIVATSGAIQEPAKRRLVLPGPPFAPGES